MTEFPVVNAIIFAGIGLIVFLLAVSLALRGLQLSFRQDVVQDRNLAAAIVLAAVILGMAWIIAAAMH